MDLIKAIKSFIVHANEAYPTKPFWSKVTHNFCKLYRFIARHSVFQSVERCSLQ
jgi:hypothetical protein